MDGILERVIKALAVKVHSTATFRSGNTGQVTDMGHMFRGSLLRSTKTLGVGTHRK